MTMTTPTEQLVEDVASVYFGTLGLSVKRGVEVDDAGERSDPAQCILQGRLTAALHRINPMLTHDTVEEVLRIVSHPPHPTLIQNNRWLHTLITDGVEVEYQDVSTGEMRGGRARLVDFENPEANDMLVVRQLTVTGSTGSYVRPDLTVLLNGLPIAVIELKSPGNADADLDTAIDQIERYKQMVPDLFTSNLLLVVSDGLLSRVGSVSSSRRRFMPWRPAEGGAPTLEALIRGLFDPNTLVDYLRNCVVFEEDERGETEKKIAGYHQFRAVQKMHASILKHVKPPLAEGDGRGGVIWHTQGSGKSLTMLMLAGTLVRDPHLVNPTVVMITDRNDLDDQLFETFAASRRLIGETPVQATSQEHLKSLLDRPVGGVIFTTIQKFTEAHAIVSDRSNIVVMADEAHRSQYGFVRGGARWMRNALPNATFAGFTGTPLERDDRNTRHVFGEYVDIYDIRQAVEDGATKPLYYESRIIKLTVDEAGARAAEEELEKAVAADISGEESKEQIFVPLETLAGTQERIERLAEFIVDHWEKRRTAMEGKAMVVTMRQEDRGPALRGDPCATSCLA